MEAQHRASRLLLVVVMSVVLFSVIQGTAGADGGHDSSSEQSTAVANSGTGAMLLPTAGSMSIPANVVQVLAVIGAVVVAIFGVAGITALLLPLFGIRLCYVLGTCTDPYAYVSGPTAYEMPYPSYGQMPYPSPSYAKSGDGVGNELPQYDAYSQVSYPTSYQKRSLEYVGPILKALSSAYDKYGHHQLPVPATPRQAIDAPPSSALETNHNK